MLDKTEVRLHASHVLYPVSPTKGIVLWLLAAAHWDWPTWWLVLCVLTEVSLAVGWYIQYKRSNFVTLEEDQT